MSGLFRNHTNAVRLRVLGTGTLDQKLISLDDVYTEDLTSVTLSNVPARQSNTLANFTQQKMQLELKTTELGDYFLLKQITIFTKPIATDYPQGAP